LIDTPLVSVIVPIYNGEQYLEATLNSVISQTYLNWELILIDDGSTDQSAALINKYIAIDKRITGISCSESSGGPAHPRNIGIREATGDYLAFLDADDIWVEQKLERQVEFIEKMGLDIVSTKTEYINSVGARSGILKRSRIGWLFTRIFGSSFSLLSVNPIALSSSLIKSNTGKMFRSDVAFQAIEDWFFWIDLKLAGKKFGELRETLLFYRLHGDSISKSNGEKQYHKGFSLFSLLLLEGKISLPKFIVLIIFQCLKILKFRFLGRYPNI
jgi:teichuronic acid biosynthesis glycosyltransferase TuaG